MDLPVTIITVISNSFLGLLTYFKKPTSATNKLFFLLSLILAIWAIINYFSLHSSDPQTTLFWIRLILAVATPMWTVLILLALTFPSDKLSLKKLFLIPLLIYTGITSVVALSPYMFTGIHISGNNISPIPGSGIILHALLAIGALFFSSFILIRRARKTSGRERLQFNFFLFGIISTFTLLITTNFIIVNLFKTSALVVFGPFSTFILVGSISYAIIKHRFLDIRLVVARSVAYTILLLIITVFYTGSIFLLSHYLVGGDVGISQVAVYAILTIFIALTFQPLKLYLEKVTEKIFFKAGYSSNELLSKLTKIMATTLDLNELTEKTLHELITTIHIAHGTFIIFHDHTIYSPVSEGLATTPNYNLATIHKFCEYKRLLIFEEEEDEQIKQMMRQLEISVALPLYVRDSLHGILLLGEKKSGDIYSTQDIETLGIFGSEVSVAVQNSKAYDEIRRFNITLSEEVKRATKDLQVVNERLKQVDQLKDDFVSIASHELRTPMTAIRSYAWMALHRSDMPLSKTLEKYIARILISTERLVNLVNDMLNISRIESGKIEINPEPVNLLSLVKDIMDELYFSKSEEKKIEFIVLEKPVPKVFADPEKLRQVFLNLVGNSLKFTPAGGKITFDFFSDGHTVEISVTDTGVGISKEDVGKLFHKFSRLDNSYTAAATSGGTGLGLYISRNLVELMHGKIRVSSEGLGKGTTVTVTLPVATADVLKEAVKYTVKPQGEVKELEPVAI